MPKDTYCYKNMRISYEMEGNNLGDVTEELDLGVIMQSDLKWDKQYLKAVNTANHILGMIKTCLLFKVNENRS
jgi:hypothetical protein